MNKKEIIKKSTKSRYNDNPGMRTDVVSSNRALNPDLIWNILIHSHNYVYKRAH